MYPRRYTVFVFLLQTAFVCCTFALLSKQNTEHFALPEFLASTTAEKLRIPNVPLKRHIDRLRNLAVRCLEPTRQRFRLPLLVTSGYRCPQLNDAVGGVPNSQHMEGFAADETFFSPYLSQTLGINRPERRSSRRRTRYNARYNEDNNDNNDNENKTITSACVCLDDTQQTDYRSYEKYMKR